MTIWFGGDIPRPRILPYATRHFAQAGRVLSICRLCASGRTWGRNGRGQDVSAGCPPRQEAGRRIGFSLGQPGVGRGVHSRAASVQFVSNDTSLGDAVLWTSLSRLRRSRSMSAQIILSCPTDVSSQNYSHDPLEKSIKRAGSLKAATLSLILLFRQRNVSCMASGGFGQALKDFRFGNGAVRPEAPVSARAGRCRYSPRRPLKLDEASVVDYPVDHGRSHLVVREHGAPSRNSGFVVTIRLRSS